MLNLLSWIVPALQVAIALGLINVWIVRKGRATKYRGGSAQNMKEEFIAYGLPVWSMYIVGFLKIVIALVMLVVAFLPHFMYPFGLSALALLVVLMSGAVVMHMKVKDSFVKTLPAILMLLMASLVLYLVPILS